MLETLNEWQVSCSMSTIYGGSSVMVIITGLCAVRALALKADHSPRATEGSFVGSSTLNW